MPYETFDLGDLVRVSGAFTQVSNGAAIDPTVVKLSIRAPNVATVTYTYLSGVVIVKDSVGNYHADIDANDDGTWHYRWWSTGTGQAAQERQFEVRGANAV